MIQFICFTRWSGHLTISNARKSAKALKFSIFSQNQQKLDKKPLELTMSFPKRRGAFSSSRPEHDLHEHGQAWRLPRHREDHQHWRYDRLRRLHHLHHHHHRHRLHHHHRLHHRHLQAVVKVDDSGPGIIAGLNAGCWTVGIAKTVRTLGLE